MERLIFSIPLMLLRSRLMRLIYHLLFTHRNGLEYDLFEYSSSLFMVTLLSLLSTTTRGFTQLMSDSGWTDFEESQKGHKIRICCSCALPRFLAGLLAWYELVAASDEANYLFLKYEGEILYKQV